MFLHGLHRYSYNIDFLSSVAFLLGESVTPPQICGGALIIGGILFSSFSSPIGYLR